MKVLLIGGAGYIGRSLCAPLLQDGFDVVTGYRNEASPAFHDLRVRGACLDLGDMDSVERALEAERPDVVVHLASALVPASDEADYLAERRAVLDPTTRLVLRLAERKIRLVLFSSGGAAYGVSSESILVEESSCRPISFYGQAKLELEELVRFVGRTMGLSYLIVRPSNPFGGSQSPSGRQGLVAAVLGCLRDKRPLQIWGDGQVVRDYIYIDDMCAVVSHLIKTGVAGVVNVGSGVGHSALDVIRTVEQVARRHVDVHFASARAVDVPRIVLDVSRSIALGARPARPFVDGVRAFTEELGLIRA